MMVRARVASGVMMLATALDEWTTFTSRLTASYGADGVWRARLRLARQRFLGRIGYRTERKMNGNDNLMEALRPVIALLSGGPADLRLL